MPIFVKLLEDRTEYWTDEEFERWREGERRRERRRETERERERVRDDDDDEQRGGRDEQRICAAIVWY